MFHVVCCDMCRVSMCVYYVLYAVVCALCYVSCHAFGGLCACHMIWCVRCDVYYMVCVVCDVMRCMVCVMCHVMCNVACVVCDSIGYVR